MTIYCLVRQGTTPDRLLTLCETTERLQKAVVVIPLNLNPEQLQDYRGICDLINLQGPPCLLRHDLNDHIHRHGLNKAILDALNPKDSGPALLIDLYSMTDVIPILEMLVTIEQGAGISLWKNAKSDGTKVAVAAHTAWLETNLANIDALISWVGLSWALETLCCSQDKTVIELNRPNEQSQWATSLEIQQQCNIVYEWATKTKRLNRLPKLVIERAQTELCSIVIPIYNNLELTKNCLESIQEHTHLPHEIILVDNGSTEPISEWAVPLSEENTHIRYHGNERNQGFPQACNQGMEMATGDVVILLNNDTVVSPHWISKLIAPMRTYPQIGITGPRSVNIIPPNRLEIAAFQSIAEREQFSKELALKNAASITLKQLLAGLCLAIKRSVIEDVGGLDPIFGIGNMEEDDYAVRVQRRGYMLALVEDLFIDHVGGAAFDSLNLNYKLLLVENHLNWQQKHKQPNDFKAHFLHLKKGGTPKQNRYHMALATDKKWDETRDKIPLNIPDLLSKSGDPMDWPGDAKERWIAFPKWLHPHWLKPFAKLLSMTDPPTLILRLEPSHPIVIEHVQEQFRRFCRQQIKGPIPAWIHFDATPIASTDRRRLYDSAKALVSLPRADAFKYEREAAAVGLEIIDLTQL